MKSSAKNLFESSENKGNVVELDKTVITKKDISRNYKRIISENISEYSFIIPYQERVELGEIFSIEDGSITFLARVTDIRYDSNYGGNWDTIPRSTDFYDTEQIFNRVVADPLGCVIDNNFKKSKTLPTKFSPVHQAGLDEFHFLKDAMGDIEIGSLRNGSKIVEEIPVKLHSKDINRHMGVFATTGMGKSNFMKVFAASCIKNAALGASKFGLLIVDPHGEYLYGGNNEKGLLDLTNYKNEGLVCYSTDPRHSIGAEVGQLEVSIQDIRPADIEVLYDWNSTQREAFDVVSRVLSRDWLNEILTLEGQDKLSKEAVHESTIGKLTKNIKNVLFNNKNIISEHKSSIPGIIKHLQDGKVVLIDIPNLGERSELFLLSLVSSRILENYRNNVLEGTKKLNCLITIEEAQRVLGGGEGSLARFKSIAREGRKFGVGLCAVTQQPKLIDKQLLSQFNSFVILGLSDKNDRIRLEDSAKQDLYSLDVEIQTLEIGEAVISTLNISFPVPVKIHPYNVYIETLNKEKRSNRRLYDDMDNTFDPDY